MLKFCSSLFPRPLQATLQQYTIEMPSAKFLTPIYTPHRHLPVCTIPVLRYVYRQLTGECGVHESNLRTWTGTFDNSAGSGEAGRVQLNLWICAPFGEYELEIDTSSYGDKQGRTSWEILSGDEEVM